MSPNLHQVGNDDPLRAALRGVLLAAVKSGPDAAGRIYSIQYRACAALYALLVAHPVDQRGRCRLCRRPGAVFGFRRHHCRVHDEARVWLQQPVGGGGAGSADRADRGGYRAPALDRPGHRPHPRDRGRTGRGARHTPTWSALAADTGNGTGPSSTSLPPRPQSGGPRGL